MKNINKYFNKQDGNIRYLYLSIILIVVAGILPYTNLFFSFDVEIILIYLIIAIVFRLSSRLNILIGVVAIIISLPWLIVGSRDKVEILGNLAFFAFIIGFLEEAYKLRKNE